MNRLAAALISAGIVAAGGLACSQVSTAAAPAGKANRNGAISSAPAAQPGEWPRWRGPSGDGISPETGLLDRWPDEGPPLSWRSRGLGNGYSSVAIAGGKIFTMGEKGDRASIHCLSGENGAILWSTTLGGGSPNCTPTVDGEFVFGLSRYGELACCKTSDGSLVWSKQYERDFGGKMMSSWGYSESPLIDGERLICTPGGDEALLAALDKQTGETIWKTEVHQSSLGRRGGDGAGYASVVISNAGGVKQYVTLVGRGVVGVDAESGKLLWSYNGVANNTANIPTPIVAGDHVFCSSGYSTGSALLKLNKTRQGFDVQEVYFLPANKMQNHHGGMIQKDGFVFCGHGHNEGFPLCINGKTGKDAWRQGRGPGSGSAAIAYADGHLYFRYQDGTMALIEATPSAYKLKGQFQIASHNGESWPHPVIAGGKLYLRDQDELLVYDVRKN
jgi:outer membrane protein assembly factor BamB